MFDVNTNINKKINRQNQSIYSNQSQTLILPDKGQQKHNLITYHMLFIITPPKNHSTNQNPGSRPSSSHQYS